MEVNTIEFKHTFTLVINEPKINEVLSFIAVPLELV